MMAEGLERAHTLLLEAVESLTHATSNAPSRANPGSSVTQSTPNAPSPADPGSSDSTESASGPSGSSATNESSGSALLRERNRLFNFGFRRRGGECSSTRGVKAPRSKKKRLATWNHDFICLSSTSCTKVPSGIEMAQLIKGGLGRKQLMLFEYNGAADLHSEILHAFPILRDGGGYELLRVSGCGTRSALHVIPQPAQGYTVAYLKEVVRQAKVYIRPVQQDLQLIQETPAVSDSVNYR